MSLLEERGLNKLATCSTHLKIFLISQNKRLLKSNNVFEGKLKKSYLNGKGTTDILLKISKEKKENLQHFEFDILTDEMVVRGQLVARTVTEIKNL